MNFLITRKTRGPDNIKKSIHLRTAVWNV